MLEGIWGSRFVGRGLGAWICWKCPCDHEEVERIRKMIPAKPQPEVLAHLKGKGGKGEKGKKGKGKRRKGEKREGKRGKGEKGKREKGK